MKNKCIALIKKKRTWFLLFSLFGACGISFNPDAANVVIELLPEIIDTFLVSNAE